MKKILCLALALVMLAGCAAAPGNDGKQEEVEQLLETGYYALREDEDGEPTGYLRVQSRQRIWYDADGNEIAKKNYEFNEEDGTYEVTKGEDFNVSYMDDIAVYFDYSKISQSQLFSDLSVHIENKDTKYADVRKLDFSWLPFSSSSGDNAGKTQSHEVVVTQSDK